MRGRQIKLYLHPDDRRDVENFIRSELKSALLPPRWTGPSPRPPRVTSEEGMSSLICPACCLDDLRPRRIEDRDEWVADPSRDPVVEWWYSKLDGSLLFPGRFYYVPGKEQEAADEQLVDAGKRLFTWVRKFAGKREVGWGSEHLGPRAALAWERGEITLRQNPPGSRI
jgi:hypothetical protein